jgi:hypothetical protein
MCTFPTAFGFFNFGYFPFAESAKVENKMAKVANT